MRVENVSVNISQKFNLGNYESFEVSVMLHAKADEDEDTVAVGNFLASQAKAIIYEQAQEILEAHGVQSPSVKKFYMGRECNTLPSELHNLNDIIDQELPF